MKPNSYIQTLPAKDTNGREIQRKMVRWKQRQRHRDRREKGKEDKDRDRQTQREAGRQREETDSLKEEEKDGGGRTKGKKLKGGMKSGKEAHFFIDPQVSGPFRFQILPLTPISETQGKTFPGVS